MNVSYDLYLDLMMRCLTDWICYHREVSLSSMTTVTFRLAVTP